MENLSLDFNIAERLMEIRKSEPKDMSQAFGNLLYSIKGFGKTDLTAVMTLCYELGRVSTFQELQGILEQHIGHRIGGVL